jgi:DNA replication and repair protein RecF
MRINTLSLHNFRNFRHTGQIEFPDSSLLVAAAPNATGKTNFLEAITVLLRGKSFRATHEECVQWGEEYFLIQGVVQVDETESTLGIQYHTPSRKLRVEENGMPVSPVTFYSHYPFMVFLPEDTFMFHRGPAYRRNFFNSTLISSSQYLASIVQYHKALRQRNAALKEAKTPEDIAPWTSMVVEHAATVWTHRESFVRYIQDKVSDLYRELFDEDYQFEISFVPGASSPEKFSSLLKEAWSY